MPFGGTMRSPCRCHALVLPAALVIMMISCGLKPPPRRARCELEQGITVVSNPETPPRPGAFVELGESYVVNHTNRDLVHAGFTRIQDYAVDSAGHVFLLARKPPLHFVYRCDPRTGFEAAFVRRGRGSGELTAALRLQVNFRDEITIRDPESGKLVVYDTAGRFVEEMALPGCVRHIHRLAPDRYLITRADAGRDGIAGSSLAVVLVDERFQALRELCRYVPGDKDFRDGVIDGGIDAFYWIVSEDRIYITMDGNGYEILVFDHFGNPLQKIRKDYRLVEYPESFKRSFRKAWGRLPGVTISFPDHLPPCHALFVDEDHHLFVQTFEPGRRPQAWVHDIFDTRGNLVGRQDLEVFWRGGSLGLFAHAAVRNGHFYSLRVRRGGGIELAVCRMVLLRPEAGFSIPSPVAQSGREQGGLKGAFR